MERIRRDFFWGSGYNQGKTSRKMHFLSWKKVGLPKEKGGIGFADVRLRNVSLISKWIPRWYSERDSKWNKCLRSKYNCNDGISLEEGFRDKKLSSLMSNIHEVICNADLGISLLHTDFKWILGDGSKILLWFDSWTSSSSPLRLRFPRLFSISLCQFITLKSFLDLCRTNEIFNIIFWKRPLREWEKEEVGLLWDYISSVKPSRKSDHLIWKFSGKPFSVKDCYNLLNSYSEVPNWEFSFIWKLKIPPKVQFFLWKLLSNSLPTAQILKVRIGDSFPSGMCKWCNRLEESSDHIFLGM